MTNPTLDAALAAIRADMDVLQPQERGLRDMANDPLNSDVLHAINDRQVLVERRLGLDQAAFNALTSLNDDLFPGLADSAVSAEVGAALEGEQTDVEAAVGGFSASGPAASVVSTFPPATPKG